MPIDDALKNIDREHPEDDESKKEGIPLGFDEIMHSYLAALKGWHKSFDDEKISIFTKWMRFNSQFETIIKPIPRKDFVELISRHDPEFLELAKVSDITEYIGNPCDITDKKNYDKLNFITKMNKVIEYDQIKMFETLGRIVIIPNLSYLAMFIKEEDQLRKYAKEIKEEYPTGAILTITNSRVTIDPEIPFNTHTLADFCRLTGIKDIAGMLDEVYSFTRGIRCMEKNPVGLKAYLFNTLGAHYPSLCLTGHKRKEQNPDDIDEERRYPPDEDNADDLLVEDIPDLVQDSEDLNYDDDRTNDTSRKPNHDGKDQFPLEF